MIVRKEDSFKISVEDRKGYISAMNNVLYDYKEKNSNKEIKLIRNRINYGNRK